MLLGADDAPVVQAWHAITQDKESSQERSLGGRQKVMSRHYAGTLNRMDAAAFSEIVASQRQESRARRLAAIARTPVIEDMPF